MKLIVVFTKLQYYITFQDKYYFFDCNNFSSSEYALLKRMKHQFLTKTTCQLSESLRFVLFISEFSKPKKPSLPSPKKCYKYTSTLNLELNFINLEISVTRELDKMLSFKDVAWGEGDP